MASVTELVRPPSEVLKARRRQVVEHKFHLAVKVESLNCTGSAFADAPLTGTRLCDISSVLSQAHTIFSNTAVIDSSLQEYILLGCT